MAKGDKIKCLMEFDKNKPLGVPGLDESAKLPVEEVIEEIPIDKIPDFPTSLPADGGNADTVDGKHASDFALASNPTIDGTMAMTRNNSTSTIQLFAYGDGFRIRATDPDAEAETVNDLIVTPNGIYTWGKENGVGRAQTKINDGGNAAKLEGYTAASLINASNTATQITSGIDLDNLIVDTTELGLWKIYQARSSGVATACTNTPAGAVLNGFTLIIFGKRSISTTDYTCTHILIDNIGVIFKRNNINGTWGSWSKASDLTLGDVNGNKPIVTSIISGNGALRLNWTPITGATAYAIVSYENGTYTTVVDDITGTNYILTGLTNDQTYHYIVRSKVNDVWSSYTANDIVSAKPRNEGSSATHYATCFTDAATAAKTVNCNNFTLVTGTMIAVRFAVTNTAASPTLNVNNTGAKAIRYRDVIISTGALAANRTYLFIYNGASYELVGDLNTDLDTKNTAGSSNTSSKIFLIGATSQAANPVTYSHDTCYIGTDGCLYSNGKKVITSADGSIRMMTGTYTGTGAARTITLGVTPLMVIVGQVVGDSDCHMAITGSAVTQTDGTRRLGIVTNGFAMDSIYCNAKDGKKYNYVAFY